MHFSSTHYRPRILILSEEGTGQLPSLDFYFVPRGSGFGLWVLISMMSAPHISGTH